MSMEPVTFADVFPEIKAFPTRDPRVFQTKWETLEQDQFGLKGVKTKKYFTCIVGKDCYGVDVYRNKGVNATEECEKAYFKVKYAADYYELAGNWLKD